MRRRVRQRGIEQEWSVGLFFSFPLVSAPSFFPALLTAFSSVFLSLLSSLSLLTLSLPPSSEHLLYGSVVGSAISVGLCSYNLCKLFSSVALFSFFFILNSFSFLLPLLSLITTDSLASVDRVWLLPLLSCFDNFRFATLESLFFHNILQFSLSFVLFRSLFSRLFAGNQSAVPQPFFVLALNEPLILLCSLIIRLVRKLCKVFITAHCFFFGIKMIEVCLKYGMRRIVSFKLSGFRKLEVGS